MKQAASLQKRPHATAYSTERSTGPQGVALTPPAYGIEAVDGPPIQCQAATAVGERAAPPQPGYTGLPDHLQEGIESLSGIAMDDVRVYYNSPKPAQIQALAYTQGTQIYVAPGQERHLPHEAWHVVQQKQGRVRPTKQLWNDTPVNDEQSLELQASIMGEKALQMRRFEQTETGTTSVLQREDQSHLLFSKLTASSPEATVQRLTALTYNPVHNRPGTDGILGMLHRREMHNATQRTLAAYLSGYDNIADTQAHHCGVCNHYVPYSRIAQAVEAAISIPTSADLQQAVTWMTGLALPGGTALHVQPKPAKGSVHGKPWPPIPLGAIPAVHVPAIPAPGGVTYAETVLNQEIDDLIFNLANDPRNLYYWPDSTGDNGGTTIDTPRGSGAMSLPALKARLSNYRTFLQGLGLAV